MNLHPVEFRVSVELSLTNVDWDVVIHFRSNVHDLNFHVAFGHLSTLLIVIVTEPTPFDVLHSYGFNRSFLDS